MLTARPGAAHLVDPHRPQLLLTDRAATRGDGVFESILFRHGRLRAQDAHLDRLEASAALIGLDLPGRAQWEAAVRLGLQEFLAATLHDGVGSAPASRSGEAADGGRPTRDLLAGEGGAEANVKLVASRGPEGGTTGTFWVLVTPVVRGAGTSFGPQNGLRVLLLERGYDADVAARAPWLLAGAKTLSYAVNLAAQRWARDHDADDAVFVTAAGEVLEGATSSVLVARRGADGSVTLLTPAPEAGILAGTTQAAAFDAARAAGWSLGHGPLYREDLMAADAVWLVSSVRLAAAVTLIDGAAVRCDPALHATLTEGLDAVL